MQLYPVFLSLDSCRVLVVGAGDVGKRKLASLRSAKARNILVLDPALSGDALAALNAMRGVVAFARKATEADIAGRQLVFAATGDKRENKRLAELCRAMNVWCNVADDPKASSFHVPATAKAGGVSLAVSTGGMSPALAKIIRMEAAIWLDESYGPLITVMGRLRPLVLEKGWETEVNSELFRSVAQSPLGELLRDSKYDEARELLAALLPDVLQTHIEELVDGLC